MADQERLERARAAAMSKGDQEAVAQLDRALRAFHAEQQSGLPPIFDNSVVANTTGAAPLAAASYGTGRALGRLGAGAQDIGTFASLEPFGLSAQQQRRNIAAEEASAEAAYRPIRDAFPVASFLGETLPYLPTPTKGMGSVLVPSALGATTYTQDPMDRALLTGAGAVGGLLGMAGRNVGRATPEAQRAIDAGLRLSPGKRTGSERLQKFEAGLEAAPPTAGPFAKARQVNQSLLNKVAAESIGESGVQGKVYGETLERARSRLSREFRDLTENLTVKLGDDMLDALEESTNLRVSSILPGEKNLGTTIDSFLAKVDDGQISGREYQKFRTDLQRAISDNFNLPGGDRNYAEALKPLVRALDDAAEGSMMGDDLARFREARKQWANLELLRNPNSVKVERGDVMPASLARVASRQDELGYRMGRDRQPLYETTRGALSVPNVVGDSGTATRSWPQHIMGANSPYGMALRTGQTFLGPAFSQAYWHSPGAIRALSRHLPMRVTVPAGRRLLEEDENE